MEVATALMGPAAAQHSKNIISESQLDRKYFHLHFEDSDFCGIVL